MAFVSMIFAYLAIAVVIIFILFAVGATFLVVGIVNKNRLKYKGKKSPVIFIVSGSILLAFPVLIGFFLIVGGVSSVVTDITKPSDYDNVTDKWRNEQWISNDDAADEAIAALLEAADKGDKEEFAELFTPNLQKSENFDELVDAFFEAYPGGLSDYDYEYSGGSSEESFREGDVTKDCRTSYTSIIDGEWYTIWIELYFQNTASPDDVGVTHFQIRNLEACALEKHFSDSEYIACCIKSENDVNARLIGGTGFAFEPTSDRKITEDQMREYVRKYDNMVDLINEIGEPNVMKKGYNSTGIDYYYELVPENDEPRYANICTSASGELLYGYICSDMETLYDRKLFPEE